MITKNIGSNSKTGYSKPQLSNGISFVQKKIATKKNRSSTIFLLLLSYILSTLFPLFFSGNCSQISFLENRDLVCWLQLSYQNTPPLLLLIIFLVSSRQLFSASLQPHRQHNIAHDFINFRIIFNSVFNDDRKGNREILWVMHSQGIV